MFTQLFRSTAQPFGWCVLSYRNEADRKLTSTIPQSAEVQVRFRIINEVAELGGRNAAYTIDVDSQTHD